MGADRAAYVEYFRIGLGTGVCICPRRHLSAVTWWHWALEESHSAGRKWAYIVNRCTAEQES